MREHNNRLRDSIITYFPMVIAIISVLASIYSAWLFSRSVEVMQRAVDRGEIMRACKDSIDAYFRIKLNAALISAGGPAVSAAQTEAVSAVARFGAMSLATLSGFFCIARDRMTIDRAAP